MQSLLELFTIWSYARIASEFEIEGKRKIEIFPWECMNNMIKLLHGIDPQWIIVIGSDEDPSRTGSDIIGLEPIIHPVTSLSYFDVGKSYSWIAHLFPINIPLIMRHIDSTNRILSSVGRDKPQISLWKEKPYYTKEYGKNSERKEKFSHTIIVRQSHS